MYKEDQLATGGEEAVSSASTIQTNCKRLWRRDLCRKTAMGLEKNGRTYSEKCLRNPRGARLFDGINYPPLRYLRQ